MASFRPILRERFGESCVIQMKLRETTTRLASTDQKRCLDKEVQYGIETGDMRHTKQHNDKNDKDNPGRGRDECHERDMLWY